MAGLHVADIEAYGLPNRRDNGREAGVLGNDVMRHAVVVFDFPCRKVEIHPKPTDIAAIVGAGAPPVHAGVDPGSTLLTVPVTVNGVAGVAVLDTGSRWTRLTLSFAKGAGIDPASSRFHDDEPIYGTSLTKVVPRTGPVGQVRFAGETLADATAQVVDLPMLAEDFGGEPAMLLGADLLGRFRFIYDHAAREVWMRPSRC